MNIFNSARTALNTGTNLIEASAGTGKTYAIAMLVLRFVVEKNIDIKNILVVTFTNAATKELKQRIRSRLVETRQLLINHHKVDDNDLNLWLTNLAIEPELVITRLNQALLDIDQASIFTIHGFCQRVLAEYALESSQLFDAKLTADISSIKQASADDFWRQNIYTRCAWETSLLTTDFKTPDQLLASVEIIAADITFLPDGLDLQQCFNDLDLLLNSKQKTIFSSLQILQKALEQDRFKKSFIEGFSENKQQIIAWINKESLSSADFYLFSRPGLLDALNGTKFRKSKANPESSVDQKSKYIDSLTIDTQIFEQIDTAINKIILALRRTLLDHLRVDIEKRLQRLNTLSFDNLICSLSNALSGEKASALTSEIEQKFAAVLIDEFQDTDNSQWHIFATLFAKNNHYLYLIGDPKQAIYKFRGADIHSYFAAKKQAKFQFSLAYNWRSHPDLVAGINHLFSINNPFLIEQLGFTPIKAALSSEQGCFHQQDQLLPPLALWQLDKSDKEFWSAGKAAQEIKTAVVIEILDLLDTDCYIKQQHKDPIKPKDIAILVRTNTQAKEFQQALNAVGITAVINNKDSVFSTQEAIDIFLLLKALAEPGNHSLLKQAMALDWFNLTGQQLVQISNDQLTLDIWYSRFQLYHQQWQNYSLMTMLMRLIQDLKVFPNLSKNQQAERRITNIQHCIELIQQAVIEQHLGINKTLDWLQSNISETESSATSVDDQQIRLESDEDAVKIMTMHSSKGLEFPIVFCPFLWQRGEQLKKQKSVIKFHSDNKLIADLGSDNFEIHRQIALEEELAEDLRVFYVAATRAKYRCYIIWANVRSKSKANDSAMAYLLNFSMDDFDQQQNKLKTYCTDHPASFEYQLIKTGHEIETNYQNLKKSKSLNYLQRHREFFSNWQMSSYTALSSLSLDDAPELPKDKVREDTVNNGLGPDKHELPRGSHTGNVIHDLLENIPFKYLSEDIDISEQRDNSCLRYGLHTESPEKIDLLLNNTVNSALSEQDPNFCLKNLTEKQCLKEMPFYLAVKNIQVSHINHILKDCPTYQSLSKKKLSGYLTGFIDLICLYQGKYYVMDYKSNSLQDYQQEALTEAMREHNYGLQYWIYSLVLHQYLTIRQANYNYEQHFGGVKYLFVRGMKQNHPALGVFQTRPELKKIQALAELILPK